LKNCQRWAAAVASAAKSILKNRKVTNFSIMVMKVNIDKVSAGFYRGGAILVFAFEDSEKMTADQSSLDRKNHSIISEAIKSKQFRGERYEICSLAYASSKAGFKRILLVGLGKKADFEPGILRQAAAQAAQSLGRSGVKDLGCTFLDPAGKVLSLKEQAQLLTEGVMMGAYRFDTYRTESKGKDAVVLEEMTLLAKDLPPGPIRDGMNTGRGAASGVNYARTLGNHPANIASPEFLAREAHEMAKRYTGLRCKVMGRNEVEKLGMGAFLSVNQASSQSRPLQLISLEYRPPRGRGRRKKLPRIGLVGKGITFDSGGMSLKNPKSMNGMKYDMSGAAAVLGILRAAADLRLQAEIVALVPATENMVSERATRPGDVVKSMSGKTIEIENTDAEGRLVLCDVLTYIQQQKVDCVIDFATLTGACQVALGDKASGLFSNHDKLAQQIEKAGYACGDRVWRLPVWEDYDEQLKSQVADMKNVGGPKGGAITAACFLRKFIEDTPWAHIDIAATADQDDASSGRPAGATGVGVLLVLELIRNFKALK
jgi:leucyl aminopeptidase